MPTSGPEKCTVTETSGLAQSRISFPTENGPIFRYRRPASSQIAGAHFARIQTEANSQYAIQETGVSSGSGNADHQGRRQRFNSCVRPIRYKKIKKRSHFTPRGHHARVRGAGTWRQRFRVTRPRCPIVTPVGRAWTLAPTLIT